MHVSAASAYGGQRQQIPLEPKLQAVVSHPVRVLGINLGPLYKQYMLLIAGIFLQAQFHSSLWLKIILLCICTTHGNVC